MTVQNKIKLPVGDNGGNPIPDPVEIEIAGVKHIVSEDGTIKDSTGKVVKTKEEVADLLKPKQTPEEIEAARIAKEKADREAAEKAKKDTESTELVEGSEVEIDGVTLTIDKDGNAIDANKQIVKTKAEVKALYDASQDNGGASDTTDYVGEIQKTTNLVILKEGKPVTYENSLEGLTGYVKDAHQLGVEIGSKKATEELFTKFPAVKQFISHLILNNGDATNFNNTVDYSKVKISDDPAQWQNIYVTAQIARGIPKEEAENTFKYFNDDKKGKVIAESSLAFLASTQAARDAEAQRILAQQEEEERNQEVAYWTEVSNIVKAKTIKVKDKTFNIPDVIRVKDSEGRTVVKTIDDFVDYMSKPVNVTIDGKSYVTTRLEYDKFLEEEERNTNDEVLEAYRRFTRYDDSQLIANAVKTETAKQKIKLSTKAPASASPSQNKGKIVLPIK